MMGSVFGKKGVIYAVCLMIGMICAVFALRVQAAETEIPQPSSAKVYSGMSDRSDIIANLIVGNVFEVVDAQNDGDGGIWYRIRTDFGVEGYVKAGELDRLVMDAQAMLPQVAAENDQGGEEAVPGEDNAEEEPVPEGGDTDDGPADAAEPEEDNAGEEPADGAEPDDSNAGETPSPDNNDIGNEPIQNDGNDGDGSGQGAAPEAENAGDGAPLENPGDDQEAAGETVSDSLDGAGVGKVMDDQPDEDITAGNEGFTVIERLDTPEVQKHGRIDTMLIMIMAGGILCIAAIGVLARKVWICVRTEV